jgi:D-amino-acid dehydrogenase
MKIIVIGAGIVGLATAYWLSKDGHEITVIDRHAEVGNGTSFGNGGQLSYSYVAPLAAPSVLKNLPRWLCSSDSPVKFRPALDPAQWGWLAQFLAACTARRVDLTTQALLGLAGFSQKTLHALMATENIDFAHRRNGKLVFFSSQESLSNARRQMEFQAAVGCEQRLLSKDECIALEPSLKQAAGRMVGAIYAPADEAGDCLLLCRELQRILSARSNAVNFRLGAEVRSLARARSRLRGVALGGETVAADLTILCTGVGTRALFGGGLPVYPLIGYSISPRLKPGVPAPDKSITDFARRTVYARLGDRLRVAGFAEITGGSLAVDPARIATLQSETAALFPGACDLGELQPWVGARPATPTGVPIIGRTRTENLFVNVGHGSLGFTLGLGSGKLLADIIAGRTTPIDAKAYALP